MTKEQIYQVLSAALDAATLKGAFSLQDTRTVTDALLALQKEFGINQDQEAK